ncbi:MAG TPA: amidohydrolase family protein, partial [Ilumatobacter sp.]|nr:amidohydrolase family protein [Ilumatobacter sp.]
MHDLVIRGGTVVDGSGMPARRADVAVAGGRITSVGSVVDVGRREIDADGHVVTPGFIDGHTHLDAQIFWDPLGTSSCWHGVTSVIMGNCGFTLAPSREGERQLVIDNLEKAEDIPAAALAEGVHFDWQTFREYLGVLERLPKGVNTGVYVGHSALRTYVMGERAFEDRATDDDLAAMERELRDALEAGAVGFTTSRSEHHVTPSGAPVASRVAGWDEVERLV